MLFSSRSGVSQNAKYRNNHNLQYHNYDSVATLNDLSRNCKPNLMTSMHRRNSNRAIPHLFPISRSSDINAKIRSVHYYYFC